ERRHRHAGGRAIYILTITWLYYEIAGIPPAEGVGSRSLEFSTLSCGCCDLCKGHSHPNFKAAAEMRSSSSVRSVYHHSTVSGQGHEIQRLLHTSGRLPVRHGHPGWLQQQEQAPADGDHSDGSRGREGHPGGQAPGWRDPVLLCSRRRGE